MNATDYCELCDLPKSQCIHGQPPPPPPVKAAAPKPRSSTRSTAGSSPVVRSTAPTKVVPRRWSQPEVFKPLILEVLENAGGELEVEEAMLELEILAEDKLLAGDRELTPEGELRWRYAARRARVALIDEGLMTKAGPGIWKLS